MFRLQGHVLLDSRIIWTALTQVYGVGLPRSKAILDQYAIPLNKRVKDLTEEEQKNLSEHLKEMLLESELRREVQTNIKRLKEIRCYRGMRHAMGLPVRGQLTGQNGHTAKKLLGRAKVRPSMKK